MARGVFDESKLSFFERFSRCLIKGPNTQTSVRYMIVFSSKPTFHEKMEVKVGISNPSV